MKVNLLRHTSARPVHPWLCQVRVAFVPGHDDPLLQEAACALLDQFEGQGHIVQRAPDDQTDILLTSAPFGEPLDWRQALLFTARRRFSLSHAPTVFTMLHCTPERFSQALHHFETALAKDPPDEVDFAFPGLSPRAHRVLLEQGRRGGPILALERLVQAQAKTIRAMLVVGEDRIETAYLFDLVGAHPRLDGRDLQALYEDVVLRLVTALSTHEVTHHTPIGEPLSYEQWVALETPEAMRRAAQELDKRRFFTEMVRIADLVSVPALAEAVANQYSEGCFATWDPQIEALIATVTGSARPVDKGNIGEADLAVIVGVQPDGSGALVRHVQGKPNDPPSSEAVEMIQMDQALPRVHLSQSDWGLEAEVPVIRSKLHGHRGVAAYDPTLVEHVALDPPYYHFPVSCATEAQARAVQSAFGRSEALQDPRDPRQIVFTVLPGHGIVVVEKWVPGKAPFQVIWEAIDEGKLTVVNHVPQGPLGFTPAPDGEMILQAEA